MFNLYRVLLVLAFAIGTQVVAASERVALLIGNSNYYAGVGDVDDVEGDIQRLRDVLANEYGFEVLSVLDAKKYELDNSLETFEAMAATSSLVLIYYVGHALTLSNSPVVVPVDVDLTSRRDAKRTVPLRKLLRSGNASAAKVIVLDTCWKKQLANGWGERAPFFRERLCENPDLIRSNIGENTMVVLPDISPGLLLQRPTRRRSYVHLLSEELQRGTGGIDLGSIVKTANSKFQRADIVPLVLGSLGSKGFVSELKPEPIPEPGVVQQPDVSDSVIPEPFNNAPETAKLLVKTTPPDAVIRIMNIVPKYEPDILLAAEQPYRILVRADGYQTSDEWVVVRPDGNGRMVLSVTLLQLQENSTASEFPQTLALRQTAIRNLSVSVLDAQTLNIVADLEGVTETDSLDLSLSYRTVSASDEVIRDWQTMPMKLMGDLSGDGNANYAATLSPGLIGEGSRVEYYSGVFSVGAGWILRRGSIDSPLIYVLSNAFNNTEVPTIASPLKLPITRSDLDDAAGLFKEVADLVNSADITSLRRSVSVDESAEALSTLSLVMTTYPSIEAELTLFSSNANRGEISSVLRIMSLTTKSGSTALPGPRWRDTKMLVRRVEGNWSRVVLSN